MSNSAPPKIQIGKHKFNTRITVKNLRRLKLEGGIDLTSTEPQALLDFAVDPVLVVTVFYYLFQDQMEAQKVTEDDLCDMCGPEEIEAMRAEVTQQMRSFSTFWKIMSTAMEDLQAGNTDLSKLAMEKLKEVSGPSS